MRHVRELRHSSGQIDAFNINILQTKGSLFATRPTLNTYAAKKQDLVDIAADMFKVVGSGAVKIPINQKYPLKDAAEGAPRSRRPRHDRRFDPDSLAQKLKPGRDLRECRVVGQCRPAAAAGRSRRYR